MAGAVPVQNTGNSWYTADPEKDYVLLKPVYLARLNNSDLELSDKQLMKAYSTQPTKANAERIFKRLNEAAVKLYDPNSDYNAFLAAEKRLIPLIQVIKSSGIDNVRLRAVLLGFAASDLKASDTDLYEQADAMRHKNDEGIKARQDMPVKAAELMVNIEQAQNNGDKLLIARKVISLKFFLEGVGEDRRNILCQYFKIKDPALNDDECKLLAFMYDSLSTPEKTDDDAYIMHKGGAYVSDRLNDMGKEYGSTSDLLNSKDYKEIENFVSFYIDHLYSGSVENGKKPDETEIAMFVAETFPKLDWNTSKLLASYFVACKSNSTEIDVIKAKLSKIYDSKKQDKIAAFGMKNAVQILCPGQ